MHSHSQFGIQCAVTLNSVHRYFESVQIRRNGDKRLQTAEGDGMIDAAMSAIGRAVDVRAELLDFKVSSVTDRTDALGDVTVHVDVSGRRFTGRGVSTDVVEASARAYLSALNKAVRSAELGGDAVTASYLREESGP